MKTGAYLLINVKTGMELKIHKSLMDMESVHHARVVTGLHDIICYVEDEDIDKLKLSIFQIRKLEGVTGTVTCFAFSD